MQVELLKKSSTYNKDGVEKTAVNFYLRCGDSLIPIQIRFFGNDEGKDLNYSGRKMVLSSFATVLPEQPPRKTEKFSVPERKSEKEIVDGNLPF